MRSRFRALDRALLGGGAIVLVAVVGLTLLAASERGDALTRNTVRLSLAWYTVALCAMMRLSTADWAASTAPGRLARWCWTWAVATFLVHLAMAFHYFHHWSHADAFERTREVSGVGEGVYVSYLFTIAWVADCAWWWASPLGYAARSPWIDRVLHAFMLFIAFNGTVIFEAGFIRWAGVAMFGVLIVAWLVARRTPRVATVG